MFTSSSFGTDFFCFISPPLLRCHGWSKFRWWHFLGRTRNILELTSIFDIYSKQFASMSNTALGDFVMYSYKGTKCRYRNQIQYYDLTNSIWIIKIINYGKSNHYLPNRRREYPNRNPTGEWNSLANHWSNGRVVSKVTFHNQRAHFEYLRRAWAWKTNFNEKNRKFRFFY